MCREYLSISYRRPVTGPSISAIAAISLGMNIHTYMLIGPERSSCFCGPVSGGSLGGGEWRLLLTGLSSRAGQLGEQLWAPTGRWCKINFCHCSCVIMSEAWRQLEDPLPWAPRCLVTPLGLQHLVLRAGSPLSKGRQLLNKRDRWPGGSLGF